MPTAEEGRRRKIFRGNGRGRPKAHWRLIVTIDQKTIKEEFEIEVRAASKCEAPAKAFQRVQEILGKQVLKDWQNPRIKAKLFRQDGNGGICGGVLFVLRTSCAHYLGALKAKGPSQMFREMNGEGRVYDPAGHSRRRGHQSSQAASF